MRSWVQRSLGTTRRRVVALVLVCALVVVAVAALSAFSPSSHSDGAEWDSLPALQAGHEWDSPAR